MDNIRKIFKCLRDWILIISIIILSMLLVFFIWGGILSFKEQPVISIIFIIGFSIISGMLIYWLFRKFLKMRESINAIGVENSKLDNIVFPEYPEDINERIYISSNIKAEVFSRSQRACENPDCHFKETIHIHHIDMNKNNNNLNNLIVLCLNCHQKAHHGTLTTSQLRNWVRANYYQLKQRRNNN